MPVAFSRIAVTLAGVLLTQGWGGPFQLYILSIKASVSSFTLLPVPLFVLMGEILWHSKIAEKALKALDTLLGRLPGRLSLFTVVSGTVFSALSGSTLDNTALPRRIQVHAMRQPGHAALITLWPVLESWTLTIPIPPSPLPVISASAS